MTAVFRRSFTQPEPVPEDGIARAVALVRSGRLHRYDPSSDAESEASALEREFAARQGRRYAVACASGGYALQLALRAAGLRPGEPVLVNAWTLAPVPGAVAAAGGVPVLVEIDDAWHVDCDDLERQARRTGARFFPISHMRGHIADMDRVTEVCRRLGLVLIEDCAHTLGARWRDVRSGNHGAVGCFSTQSYKHLNSGEGGLLATDDPDIAARAVPLSGSYMFWDRHGARPADEVFERWKLDTPDMSGRMDELRAAILRTQLALVDERVQRWSERYRILEEGLGRAPGLRTVPRRPEERFVGSSIQFHADGIAREAIPEFVAACGRRGVRLAWFGCTAPEGFTSRWPHWRWCAGGQSAKRTEAVLATTLDMRIPLAFDPDDCRLIATIVAEEAARFAVRAPADEPGYGSVRRACP